MRNHQRASREAAWAGWGAAPSRCPPVPQDARPEGAAGSPSQTAAPRPLPWPSRPAADLLPPAELRTLKANDDSHHAPNAFPVPGTLPWARLLVDEKMVAQKLKNLPEVCGTPERNDRRLQASAGLFQPHSAMDQLNGLGTRCFTS